MNTAPSDLELIALIERIAARTEGAERDAELALKALYDATAGKLYGLALRVVSSRDHAEDVCRKPT